MEYVVVGLNHKSAPVSLRERVCFSEADLKPALKTLLNSNGVEEGLILSTCNRVEVYAACPSGAGIESVKRFLTDFRGVPLKEVEPHLYGYRSREAVRHGFRVTSSLDSMVVGETQITGQIKRAFEQAVASKTSGIFLHRFMQQAIQVAKKVRLETGISHHPVSVGSASVDLAKQIFGNLAQKRVALIGAGKIGEKVLTSLKSEGVTDIRVYNRTVKTLEIDSDASIRVLPLEAAWEGLLSADVVVTSLGGNDPFLTKDKVASLMEARKRSPLFLIDLGLPRNIEEAVNKIGNVYLYNIDDLGQVIRSNREIRAAEAVKAEEIVEKEATHFYESMRSQEPTIARLGQKFDEIRRKELERTLKKLSHLTEDDKKAVEKCAEAIVTRILHDPVFMLRNEASEERDWDASKILKKLFRLEES